MKKIPGDSITYMSIDSVVETEQAVHYPTEFLNSLNPPGLPSHRLELKENCPIMLLRNLDPPKLCNGTRLLLTRLNPSLLTATIMTGM